MITCNRKIIPKYGKLFIGCSAGLDSISVAHFAKYVLKRDLCLLHFNHKLRSQNDLMEQRCVEFAKHLNVDIEIHQRTESINAKDSLEAQCREWRLKFFKNFDNVILAHHLNDCVEQYLINCLKGCQYKNIINSVQNFGKLNIIRPFLQTKKLSFHKYILKNNLSKFVVEDETNKNNRHFRNWIRNEIITTINQRNYGIEKVVLKKIIGTT
ncbi:MAG: hypothetical protein BAJALOKI3v1_50005 [Promethearchaeota archaeon]|nr:MAG: hypothetical protein BAJALOKI3v1_50005 [Candidatus Lokiarchaeota archaeon]